MARYRFRLPDGQTFESERTPAQIRKAHPSAVITHRVEFDDVGNPQFHPFEGKQTGEESETAPEDEKEAPSDDEVADTGKMTLKSGKKA